MGEDVQWSELPSPAREAAEAIGFDEKRWDDKEWLPIDDKHWEDLAGEEKTACETLGWDIASWDTKYGGSTWEDMPAHVQKAANKLGWDQEKWDTDCENDTWKKGWDEFTKDEQRCLHIFGYCVQTWD